MLGVTCACCMGKGGGGDQLGSTTSEGYKALQLIRQGGATVARSWQVFSALLKCFFFKYLLSFQFRSISL